MKDGHILERFQPKCKSAEKCEKPENNSSASLTNAKGAATKKTETPDSNLQIKNISKGRKKGSLQSHGSSTPK